MRGEFEVGLDTFWWHEIIDWDYKLANVNEVRTLGLEDAFAGLSHDSKSSDPIEGSATVQGLENYLCDVELGGNNCLLETHLHKLARFRVKSESQNLRMFLNKVEKS